jgi:hypothetical protein
VAAWWGKRFFRFPSPEGKGLSTGLKTPLASMSESRPGYTLGRDQVLEIAPGPGYLAIELAKLGAFKITGNRHQPFVRPHGGRERRTGRSLH